MVRAGVVKHPSDWGYGGYSEIQNPRQRYTLIDRDRLTGLIGVKDDEQLRAIHSQWVEEELGSSSNSRDPKWTLSIAVGDEKFVKATQSELGRRAIGRKAVERDGVHELKEGQAPYVRVSGTEKVNLSQDNSHFWEPYFENTDT